MISSGSKSRVKEERKKEGEAQDHKGKQGVNRGKTHS
jgi:hypothetical protein